jgi:hypothetical protein
MYVSYLIPPSFFLSLCFVAIVSDFSLCSTDPTNKHILAPATLEPNRALSAPSL